MRRPSGITAIISKARHEVMLVEQGACSENAWSVQPFMTCYDMSEQMIIRGLFEEIVDRMVIWRAIHPKDVRWETPYTAWMKEGMTMKPRLTLR